MEDNIYNKTFQHMLENPDTSEDIIGGDGFELLIQKHNEANLPNSLISERRDDGESFENLITKLTKQESQAETTEFDDNCSCIVENKNTNSIVQNSKVMFEAEDLKSNPINWKQDVSIGENKQTFSSKQFIKIKNVKNMHVYHY